MGELLRAESVNSGDMKPELVGEEDGNGCCAYAAAWDPLCTVDILSK